MKIATRTPGHQVKKNKIPLCPGPDKPKPKRLATEDTEDTEVNIDILDRHVN